MKKNLQKIIAALITINLFGTFCITIKAVAPSKNGNFANISLQGDTDTEFFCFEECNTNMIVGEQQTVTVRKTDSLLLEPVVFASSDEMIATIDDFGVINALKEGMTEISATCAQESISFILNVSNKSEEVTVENIKIEGIQNEIFVGDTFTITTKIIPENATDFNVTYASSNEDVLSVSSLGEAKGISKGNATIIISAGALTKTVDVEVLTKTTAVYANASYLVLNEGEGFQLKVWAKPNDARQNFTFSSADSTIVSVNSNGYIKAHRSGNALIIYGNSDMVESVSIIVNKKTVVSKEAKKQVENDEVLMFENLLNAQLCKKITAEMLRYYYEKNDKVTIEGKGYTIRFLGENILNYENEFDTDLNLRTTSSGIVFDINHGSDLFGTIGVEIPEIKGKHLYIYDGIEQKYNYLGLIDNDKVIISVEGEYLISETKISASDPFIITVGAISGITFVTLLMVYIFKKKKYWFW